MLKTLLTKLGVGLTLVVLMSTAILPTAFAETPATVIFGVGINDYPDHQDYSKTKNLPNTYLNVYEIVADSTLGYYKGVLRETIETGADGAADVSVQYGTMVNFLGFKNKSDAISRTYSTWKFYTPPYKNFGNDVDKLCQTNFFDFNEYLKSSADYACATSLSTPYQVTTSSSKWLSAVTLKGTSANGEINASWSTLSGLGTDFDKYNVLFKKGYYTSLSGNDVAKSYVSWDYYNLVGLTKGDWWTFQVVPVKSVNGSYVEVGAASNVIQVQVQGAAVQQDLATPYITSPYSNQTLTNFPREAYISWTSIYGATKYEVEVACDVCSSTSTKWLNPSTYTSTKNYLTTPALAGDNQFRVRVRAVDGANNIYSDWSSYVYFRYNTAVQVEDKTAYQINLSITSWDTNGLPKVAWSAYQGTFDGYAMFVREGFFNENEVTWEDPAYFNSGTTVHQMVKMKEFTNYTVRILPYKQKATGREFIYPGSNTIQFKTAGASANSSLGQSLPPAGYEDEVLTAFNPYKNPFPDTSLTNLDGKSAAELYRRGVIGGFPDGEFKGDRDVNRAELTKFLLLARYASVDDVSNNAKFYDVLEGQWYTKFVVTAANKGIISGYADGSFKPGATVNVAEFLKMLTLTFGLQTNLPYSYYDVSGDEWYAPYAGVAKKYDIFPGHGNYLDASSQMTRSQVAIAIYQFLLNR